MSADAPQIQPANRRPRHRLAIIAASIVAVAAGTLPLTAHGAGAGTTRDLAGSRQMRQLQAHGYVPALCTRKGTLMVNSETWRRVIVTLA